MRRIVPALVIALQSSLIAFSVHSITQNVSPVYYLCIALINLVGIGLNLYALTK